MAVYITKKQSWLRALFSFVPGAGAAFLLCFLLSGPRLGPLYDVLLNFRPALPVSGELLIIDTLNRDSLFASPDAPENILEPNAVFLALLAMTELNASTLILEAPILGFSAGGTAGEAEIRYRFDQEFGVLSRNIQNLFDAIRTGSVAPQDASRYVNELVDLSRLGKERLMAALIRRDEEGLRRLEKAAAAFGNVRRPGDLLVQVIRTGAEDDPGALADHGEYSRVRPDPDGRLRRIFPVKSEIGGEGRVLEHIIYGALKPRYRLSTIETLEDGFLLANMGGPGGTDHFIQLDTSGALLFEIPRHGEDFRRINLTDFFDYSRNDERLRRLLGEAEVLGIYRELEGERNPVFLYDYAQSLLEDLLEADGEKKAGRRIEWINARSSYFEGLEDFLYGPSEMNLVSGYEELIASEPLGEDGLARLVDLRDSMIRAFVELREAHTQVVELRNKLAAALDGAFCILGPASSSAKPAAPGFLGRRFPRLFPSRSFTDVEASALLANSLLTGRAVQPGRDLWLLASSLCCALLCALLLRATSAFPGLGLGIVFSGFLGAAFSLSFIFSGLWLDPLAIIISSCTVTCISFFWALVLKLRFRRLFRLSYGPCVSRRNLTRLIRAGQPRPGETITARAAVVAVRNPGLLAQEHRLNPRAGAGASLEFRRQAAESFREAGGAIIGGEGDLVLACFGSPLERIALRGKTPYEDHIHARQAPTVRAAGFVSELLKRPESSLWYYGIDAGECTFTWSALSGYSAFGRPAVRARILSGLVSRYKAKVLITASASEALPDFPAKKLDVLRELEGNEGEAFYELKISI
jgi:class 3 adenylate cyclase